MLRLVAEGQSNKAIGVSMGLSADRQNHLGPHRTQSSARVRAAAWSRSRCAPRTIALTATRAFYRAARRRVRRALARYPTGPPRPTPSSTAHSDRPGARISVRRTKRGGRGARARASPPPASRCRPGTTLENLAGLKTPSARSGRVTAAQRAPVSPDGASAPIPHRSSAASSRGHGADLPVKHAPRSRTPVAMASARGQWAPARSRPRRSAPARKARSLPHLRHRLAVSSRSPRPSPCEVLGLVLEKGHSGVDGRPDARAKPVAAARIAFGHPLASSARALRRSSPRQFEEQPGSATASTPCASASACAAPHGHLGEPPERTRAPEATSEQLHRLQTALKGAAELLPRRGRQRRRTYATSTFRRARPAGLRRCMGQPARAVAGSCRPGEGASRLHLRAAVPRQPEHGDRTRPRRRPPRARSSAPASPASRSSSPSAPTSRASSC
ncbi:hypothetical protein SALBM135S_05101 [Streptomyces alboniger]